MLISGLLQITVTFSGCLHGLYNTNSVWATVSLWVYSHICCYFLVPWKDSIGNITEFFFTVTLICANALLHCCAFYFRWFSNSKVSAYINLHRQCTYAGRWGKHAGAGAHRPWLDVYHLKASQRWEHTSSSWQQQQQTQEQKSHHLQMLRGEKEKLKISAINIQPLMCVKSRCFGLEIGCDGKQQCCLLLGLVWYFEFQDHIPLVSGKLQIPVQVLELF